MFHFFVFTGLDRTPQIPPDLPQSLAALHSDERKNRETKCLQLLSQYPLCVASQFFGNFKTRLGDDGFAGILKKFLGHVGHGCKKKLPEITLSEDDITGASLRGKTLGQMTISEPKKMAFLQERSETELYEARLGLYVDTRK